METLKTVLSEIGRIIEYPIVHINQSPLTITSFVVGFIILLIFIFLSRGLRNILKNQVFPQIQAGRGNPAGHPESHALSACGFGHYRGGAVHRIESDQPGSGLWTFKRGDRIRASARGFQLRLRPYRPL